MSDPLKCRARVHADCYHGRDDQDIYYDESWRTDGTYLRDSDSVVCDACYIALGTPDNGPELEDAIAQAREAKAHG